MNAEADKEETMSDPGLYTPGPASGARIEKDGEKWTLVLVRELRHSPEKVWEAITDPAQLREWAPFDADGSLGTAGNTAKLTTVAAPSLHVTETRVTRADAPHLLEYNWGDHDMRWHSVTSRVKKRANLQEKLGRLGKDYQSLDEVTDLVGVRIITHFEDEVDRIATIIESEFAIDRNKSVDKRIILDPDRFGYLSIHYICTLSEARARLVEYKQFKEKICEIQIRSILQHAWAEIEHDLGYKPGSVVPAPIRRRFSRLAGLLELADIEFMQIRETLSSYAGDVEKALTEPFAEINLDDVSLQAFIQSDGTVRDLDQAMAEHVRAILVDPGNVQRLLEELRFVGLQTISDLRNALQANKNLVLDQFKKRLRDETHDHLVRGISLFHLFQVLLVQQGGRQKLLEAFEHFTIGPPGQRLDSAVDEIEAVVLGHMHNP